MCMCMGTEGMEGGNFNSDDFSSRISDNDSLRLLLFL